MGFKKGRAARAAAAQAQAAGCSSKTAGLRHDNDCCVIYEAPNGWTYKIDVLKMVQVNVSKGTRRNVHRHQGHAKNWSMWQYEAERAEGRNYTHSKTTLVQYPKEVCIALEDRFKAARALAAKEAAEGTEAVEQQRSEQRWRARLDGFGSDRLREVFHTAAVESDAVAQAEALPSSHDDVGGESAPTEELSPALLSAGARSDAALREVLLELALRQHRWAPCHVVEALRWLIARGLQPGVSHVRKSALLHGGLAPLRVLLLEARVDVRGMELLVEHRQAAATGSSSSGGGGWVQRCKPALKALLGRGAVLGSHSLQSRLLKRLEEDGLALWVARVLECLRCERPELPDAVLEKIAEFTGAFKLIQKEED